MSTSSTNDPLLEVISELVGVRPHRLADDRSLFHDFGVSGDDGADLLAAIGDRFQLDMSRVDWVRYFGPELPYNPLYHLWCLLRGRRLDHDIVKLRISDLRRSVSAGRWIEPSG